MNRNVREKTIGGLAAVVALSLSMTLPAAAQTTNGDRQKDKNNMRDIGAGVGALGVWEALHNRGLNALILGAGAAYAVKKAQDDQKAQDKRDSERRYGQNSDNRSWSRGDATYRNRYRDTGSRRAGPRTIQYGTTSSNMMPARRSWSDQTGPINVSVNGEAVQFADAKPEMTAGNVYVPLRGVLEKLGANVRWDPQSRSVIAIRGDKNIRLPVDGMASVNGEQKALDTPAYIENGRTMVPLRFMAETLGAQVNWDAANHDVTISAPSV